MKPNYRQERAQRSRTKEMRKQEKLQKREDDAAKRRALRESAAKLDGEQPTDAAAGPAKIGIE
jgi:hypothetical protein